jgi:hypothetical protein
MLANKPKANVVLLSIVKAAYDRTEGRGVHDSGSTGLMYLLASYNEA